jgi:DNA-binding NarL/FixJ family response regulator
MAARLKIHLNRGPDYCGVPHEWISARSPKVWLECSDAVDRVSARTPDAAAIKRATNKMTESYGESRPIRVLLVDDHQLLTGALSQMLSREPDIIVMLTALTDDETVLESIQAGADGYLTKDRAIDEVVNAVRAAYAGETLLPRSVIVGIAQRVAAARERGTERRQIEPLTPRELEVLKALTEGLATPEICERLYIAPNTLRTHVQNIMGKLRVHSKLEAVAFALRHRLVEPPKSDDSLF